MDSLNGLFIVLKINKKINNVFIEDIASWNTQLTVRVDEIRLNTGSAFEVCE